MHVQQFVMAYGVEHDRLRALLPSGYTSLRPVLRINAEIWEDGSACLELNTAVEREGIRGWLNIAHWEKVPHTMSGKMAIFTPPGLTISFTGMGIQGGCPTEKDNAGCFFPGREPELRPAEVLTAPKEFCDCTFAWENGNGGKSLGKTLPAIPTAVERVYAPVPCTAESAAAIPCTQVLGAYTVIFDRCAG